MTEFNNNNKYVPQAPKTYEQFVLEEPNLTNQQDLYPDLVCENIQKQRGYGPSSGGIDYELHITGSCPDHLLGIVAQKHKAHWEKLIIRLRDGNFWYYTNDPTSGVGGDSSWWSRCNIFTSAVAMGDGNEQWRTREMKISSPYSAEQSGIKWWKNTYFKWLRSMNRQCSN